MRERITSTEVDKMKSLRANGMNIKEISRKLGRSSPCVSKYLKGIPAGDGNTAPLSSYPVTSYPVTVAVDASPEPRRTIQAIQAVCSLQTLQMAEKLKIVEFLTTQ